MTVICTVQGRRELIKRWLIVLFLLSIVSCILFTVMTVSHTERGLHFIHSEKSALMMPSGTKNKPTQTNKVTREDGYRARVLLNGWLLRETLLILSIIAHAHAHRLFPVIR